MKRMPDDKVLETMSSIESRVLRLQRKLARTVSRLEGENGAKGNAIIGYKQVIDDEGLKNQKIVIRGYGTAVIIDRATEQRS